jgi:hypothetical protein
MAKTKTKTKTKTGTGGQDSQIVIAGIIVAMVMGAIIYVVYDLVKGPGGTTTIAPVGAGVGVGARADAGAQVVTSLSGTTMAANNDYGTTMAANDEYGTTMAPVDDVYTGGDVTGTAMPGDVKWNCAII